MSVQLATVELQSDPAAQHHQHALTISDLSVSYRNTIALRNVSLNIPQNQVTAIVGPSGCGKSTLLSAINRLSDLVPECTLSGSIHFGGKNIFGPFIDLLSLRRSIGMVFQKPTPFPFSIRRNFSLPLKEIGVKQPEQLETRMREALKQVGLLDEVENRLHRNALELSGGQQQRLCIARALCLEPKVLLFDEPCSALDPVSSGVIEDLISSLKERVTVLLVTHNLPQAKRIADHVAVFWADANGGRLIESGTKENIFENPVDSTTRAYIDGVRG